MRVIHDTEFPNSVDATQKLLNEQGGEYDRLKVCSIVYRHVVCVCYTCYVALINGNADVINKCVQIVCSKCAHTKG